MMSAGLVFALTNNFWLLLFTAILGIISPSGQEVGPFLPIEQAMLARMTTEENRTGVFAWYTLTGGMGTALGALSAGVLTRTVGQTVGADRQLSSGCHPLRDPRIDSGIGVLAASAGC